MIGKTIKRLYKRNQKITHLNFTQKEDRVIDKEEYVERTMETTDWYLQTLQVSKSGHGTDV